MKIRAGSVKIMGWSSLWSFIKSDISVNIIYMKLKHWNSSELYNIQVPFTLKNKFISEWLTSSDNIASSSVAGLQ